MKKCLAVAIALLAAMPVASSFAQDNIPGETGRGRRGDNAKHTLGAKQFELRQKALQERLNGRGSGRVHEVAKGQYVELEQTRSDRIFVVIAEFGNTISPFGGTPGPLHNQIAEPDRSVNNTTIWQENYNSQHYRDLYFSSQPGANTMANYYRTQSSGRYGFSGDVTEWVLVPFNEARYGTNICGSNVCSSVWALVRDAINIWTAQKLASGMTPAQVKAYLDTFDVWDRYDYDGDGNFDEPDGYIDHFQIVHAGEGEETGGGAQGADAIWSHRWYAYFTGIGTTGPEFNKFGGTQFGGTGIWVGDYTIQPENGGLGVFAHEYAHDLGLPDAYDTNAGENSTAFWTIMSSGSYNGDGTVDIGARPNDFSAWEKFQLGWLNYEVSFFGKRSTHRLGPAEANTKQAQGLFTVLPLKPRTLTIATPVAGTYAWWGGTGANLDNHMTRTVALPAGPASLSMQAWYEIETDWDYAYVAVSTDGGTTFTNLPTNRSTATNPNGQNFGNGITGVSGGWVAVTADLTPYADQTIQLRFRYWTDGFVHGKGILIDEIQINGGAVFADGAESSPNGWTLDGFKQSTGTETTFHNHYYVTEFRQYRTFDETLETGPYNFSYVARPDWVDHFPYQDGVLISYWDTSMEDNNTSQHPGEGLILPIDAHPVPLIRGDGNPWRARVQAYDSTFGQQPTDPISLGFANFTTAVQYPVTHHPSLPAVPVFRDRLDYWSPLTPLAGVQPPKTGTAIEVTGTSAHGSFAQVHVRPD
jgi:immune inhibitor A